MKDGHLNKCSLCTLKDVVEWRLKNPNCRKEEHQRNAIKKNILTREEWKKKKADNAVGKRITANKYAHKRRLQVVSKDELTEFIFAEASRLRDLRRKLTGIEWHIDHIVPLNYKKACGLHTAFNFQVVPAAWNIRKKNLNIDTYFEIAGY